MRRLLDAIADTTRVFAGIAFTSLLDNQRAVSLDHDAAGELAVVAGLDGCVVERPVESQVVGSSFGFAH